MTRSPPQTGVYCIRNRVNGKMYVGSTARYGFRKRWYFHRRDLRLGVHHSRHLQSAWKKYGPTSFVFSVLLRCPPEDCVRREQEFLDCFQSYDDVYGYNISPTAGSTLGAKWGPLTPEQKKQRSESSKARWNNTDYKEKLALRMKQVMATDGYKRNHKSAMQALGATEEFRQSQSKRLLEFWKNRTEEEREAVGRAISTATKARYEDSEERRKTSEAVRKGWQKMVWYEKVCTHCDTTYTTPFPSRTNYCSKKCSQRARRARR